jgi:prepilin-type N-terminal cleavage/methylation domain-containing protein
MRTAASAKFASYGFSLIELAVVLFIIALLMGGLLPTISSQIAQKNSNETIKQLDDIQQALIGYAVINGRLPCPASDTSNGLEDPLPVTGTCTNFYNGFVPAATLGIPTSVDNQGRQGFAVDGWGNRIRYAVTKVNAYAFTSINGMKTAITAAGGDFSTLTPDLYVCASSPNPLTPSKNMTSSPWCGTATILTDKAPALIYSTGKNGGYGGSSADELANANPYANPTAIPNSYEDKVFVSHDQTPTFDDLVIWISPNILINRMVTAGVLP